MDSAGGDAAVGAVEAASASPSAAAAVLGAVAVGAEAAGRAGEPLPVAGPGLRAHRRRRHHRAAPVPRPAHAPPAASCFCCSCSSASSSAAAARSSTVTFGSGSAVGGAAAASFTPMVRNPLMETFYYVQLVGVSVGGARVPGVLESDLRLDPTTGRGGVIVDSGTSVTRLARPAYAALRDAFRGSAAGLRLSPGGFSLFDTCYDLAGQKVVKVPTVSMHFAGGGQAALPPENYLIPVDTKGTFCFAFAGTDGGVSIIGNIQQQGFRVVFDGDSQRVGFAPKGC